MSQLYLQHDPFHQLQALLWTDAFWSDLVWMAATLLCTGWGMTAVALLFVWWRTGSARRLLRRTAPAFASLLLAGTIAQGLKSLVRSPRPLQLLEPGTFHVLLERLEGTRSFPSGHSASAAALAAWAVLYYRWRAWPLVVLGVLGGLSRVAVGAHWTFDVLGGWTVGVLAAVVVRAVEPRVVRSWRTRGARPDGSGPDLPRASTDP